MRKIFDAIATSGSNNHIVLREFMDGYCQGVENHNQIHSSFLLQSTMDTQLIEAKGFVKTLRLDENHILTETNTVKHHLTRISVKEAKLEAKQMVVRTNFVKLSDIISKHDMELKRKQHEIPKTCEEIDKLECAPNRWRC